MPTEAIELLRAQAGTFRIYRAGTELADVVAYTLESYRKRFPDQSWEGHFKQLSPGGPGEFPSYAVRPMVRWGVADTGIFKRRWNVTLPDWMQEFYGEITCALLPMLNPISIKSPAEAVYHEEEMREASGETNLPYRVIRFADAAGDGTGFSLRQRLSDDTWHIIPTSGRFSRAEYQSESWEEVRSDTDINQWLLRMLRTDGHPLKIGNEDIEPMPYYREEGDFHLER